MSQAEGGDGWGQRVGKRHGGRLDVAIAILRRPRLGGLVQGGTNVERRRAAQIARMQVIVRTAAMHRTAIIPNYEISDPPFVAVDKFGAGCMQVEIVGQLRPSGTGQPTMCEACADK